MRKVVKYVTAARCHVEDVPHIEVGLLVYPHDSERCTEVSHFILTNAAVQQLLDELRCVDSPSSED